jgi:chromosome segregation ATPase
VLRGSWVERGTHDATGELRSSDSTKAQESSGDASGLSADSATGGVRRLHKGSIARSVHYDRIGKASRAFYKRNGTQHSRLAFTVEENSPRRHSSKRSVTHSHRGSAEERILLSLLWLVDAMSTKKATKKTPSSTGLSTKAKQWEGVRKELEAKVISLQDELAGMRKWCLAALGEAEKRTGELRAQNAATQRQLIEETQRKVEAIQAAEANLQKLQEEKKLKLMVYGQTLTKHKEMAEEADELQRQLEDESAAREDAERRLADVEAETEHLQSQLAHLEREFQLQLTQHHETAATNTEEYEAQIEKLAEEKSAAEAALAKLEQEMQGSNSSRRSMETRIADMEAASNAKDHQLADLRATVERLSAQVEDKTESVRRLETDKHDMSLALSRETEAQRHLKERVNELTRDTEVHFSRTKELGDKHDDVYAQLTAATAALHDEQAKREKAEAEVVRLSAHCDLPAKVLATEKAMQELQIKLGAAEAAVEIANVNVATWKDGHARLKEDSRKVQEDLEAELQATTAKNEAKISELTEALAAEQHKCNRLESETSRLTEESRRFLESKDKQDGQIETLTLQVQDLRRLVSDKDAEITKFNATAQKLSEHIADLETKDTKSGHLIETTAAEKLRLTEELKVATQQLDMMREVTRQLYAKITEQVRCNSNKSSASTTMSS